jgi:hypothetical protein
VAFKGNQPQSTVPKCVERGLLDTVPNELYLI